MLRFQHCPDQVFQAILHKALEWTQDTLHPFLPAFTPRQSELQELDERYAESYPGLARFFSRSEAIEVIGRLLTASKDTVVYDITDYHWLVIYECLEQYCQWHNDLDDDELRRAGSYLVGKIIFDHIVDHFFWDTDFLFGEEVIGLDPEVRRHLLGASDEAFSIAAGLKPHPDELKIVAHRDPEHAPEDMRGPGRRRVPVYPPRRARWFHGDTAP